MIAINFFTDVLPGFAVVIAVPLILWWYVRRTRGTKPNRLRISDKAALGKNTWVAVVEIDDKRLLVGAGESGVGLISELKALPEPVEESVEEPATDAVPATDTAGALPNGITEPPRIGLVRRLQLMTVRGPAQSPWRSVGASRR
ncbi:MAG: flagellar biosynthetic protein FliO [Acidimicrobiia bacterium]|nr:flagellar biosynthetic protein FliO [Acidimicrobiia bacterium]